MFTTKKGVISALIIKQIRVAYILSAILFAQLAMGQQNAVTSYTLINPATNQPVAGFDPIANGAVINKVELGLTSFNIRVNTNPNNDLGSVEAILTGATSKTQLENSFPWAVFGDSNGNFGEGNLNNGAHTISATPYSANSKGGAVGQALTINFTVTDTVIPDNGNGSGVVAISGELKQWHRVDFKQEAINSSVMASKNPFRDYRFNVEFTAPSGKTYLVPGYYAADGNGGDSGKVWMAHLNPHETGAWSYKVSFREGADVAVDLSASAGNAVAPYDGVVGTFVVGSSDKSGDDFRAPEKGMLVNRGNHYLTYGGNGKPFIYTGPGIPENILGYRGFHNTTLGDGHVFAVHQSNWNLGDPDWSSSDGRNLNGRAMIGALNYIADQGGNCLYMMSNTIGGDSKDTFPHPTSTTTKDRYDLLKLKQWDIALAHAQSKGIFLHWHLAEVESGNSKYYGGTGPFNAVTNTMTVERKLSFRMLNAVFGHYNALKWNLMEETKFVTSDRTAQMQYIHAVDPYDHPVTYQVGGAGIAFNTYDSHLNDPNIDAGSFQTGRGFSRVGMFNIMQEWRTKSANAGNPWTIGLDEPQKIENDNNDQARGYPHGRRDKMWPILMGGGDGFMWYIQQDGGGHGFDQKIEDFTIMKNAFNWSGYARDFLEELPLLEMSSSLTLVSSTTGNDYCLHKQGEIYAVYNDRVGTGMTLDLSGVSGTFSVKWFDPRNAGGLQTGSVVTVEGGGTVSLGNAPNNADKDWAIIVQLGSAQNTKKIAYIYGDVSANGVVPSGASAPYDQMLIDDAGNTGLSRFRSMVEAEGHTISAFYDQNISLTAAFLNQYDVVVFGLHQKIWSTAEKSVLDTWLENGGGMLIYSDSASGGRFNLVGAQNNIGQTVTNNLISQYGMEVTVDQANGIKAFRAGPDASHPIVAGRPVLEGEGVSPIAVDPIRGAIRLIPYENTPDNKVSGNPDIPHQQNVTISNPKFAALALARVGSGNVLAMFDRQPMWNSGPGSDISKRDNEEILRRIINFLAADSEIISAPPVASDLSVATNESAAVNFTLLATDDDDDNLVYAFTQPANGQLSGIAPNLTYTPNVGFTGMDSFTFTANDNQSVSNIGTVTITVNAVDDQNGNVVVAINSGGGAYTAADGTEYQADNRFVGGASYTAVGSSIAGTTDDTLYRSERYGAYSYNIPLTNGVYSVTLKMAEIYFGQVGQRIFDVNIEGVKRIEALDVRAVSGGQYVALDRTFMVNVTDGILNIQTLAVVQNPSLHAILVKSINAPMNAAPVATNNSVTTDENTAVLVTLDASDADNNNLTYTYSQPANGQLSGVAPNLTYTPNQDFTGVDSFTFTANDGELDSNEGTVNITVNPVGGLIAAINCGGEAFLASDGIMYQADQLFVGGRPYKLRGGAIANTIDDKLYKTERFGDYTYSIPVTNGSYTVTLKMGEIYHNAIGMRLFDVSIEGNRVIDGLDLFAVSGGKNIAYDRTFEVNVTDGMLNIQTSSEIDNASIHAILVTN